MMIPENDNDLSNKLALYDCGSAPRGEGRVR
jgi:hypothetical protein